LAVLFILALVVAPPLISPNGLLTGTRAEAATAPSVLPSTDKQTRARAAESFGKLPLYFVENRGQLDKRAGYYVQGSDKTIYFTNQGLTFLLNPKPEAPTETLNADHQQSERWTLKLDFVGARAGARPEGKEQTGATFSYFKGSRSQWQAGVKSYSQIVYRDLWLGIDLVYAGTVNRMKYTFVVKPSAYPNRIKLAWNGASGVKLNAAGELEVSTPAGGFTDERPVSWQETNGRQVEVASKYKIEAKGEQRNQQRAKGASAYGFEVGKYDRSRELVIDPAVLVYCGYIGGIGSDGGIGIAVDSVGNAYVTGTTNSTETSFPVTVGLDLTHNGGFIDAFVAKISPPTPQDQVSALIDQVQALVTAGVLTQKDAKGLINKLENALDKLDKGNMTPACNQLDSFINKVNQLINDGSLRLRGKLSLTQPMPSRPTSAVNRSTNNNQRCSEAGLRKSAWEFKGESNDDEF
jgi:hypothetical protein